MRVFNLNQQSRQRQFPAGNPLANLLVVIVGILVISLSLALGFVVLVGMAGFVLITAAIMSIRGWWLRRRFVAGKGEDPPGSNKTTARYRIIEGEFHEVPRRDTTRREP